MYGNVLQLLDRIINNPANEIFVTGIGALGDQFVDLLDDIKQESDEISIARNNLQLYANYQILEDLLDSIHTNFPTYNFERYDELKVLIAISKVISDQVADFTITVNVTETDFDIIPLDSALTIPQFFYARENRTTFTDSVILFSPSQYSSIERDLRTANISIELLFIFLSKIGLQSPLPSPKYLVVKVGHPEVNKVNSFLLMQMVSDGHVIHIPKVYSTSILNPWKDEIKIENRYQQFFDIFDVISEYNSIQNIIEKYLKLYQVIEDYMYKSALVKLERERNGQIFSLRDFKRMNEEVSTKEIVALKNFITDVFNLEYASGTSFKAYCLSQWSNLIQHYQSATEINSVIAQFKVMDGDNPFTYSAVNLNNVTKFFSHLVYNLRNSIVHNKTTEFHLTYRTLNNDIYFMIGQFIIPVLENIVFLFNC